MTDDIVTRLRESSGMTTSRSDDGFLSIHPDMDLMRLAADEIERLRTLLECPWCIYHHGYFCTKHGELRRD